ncbi:MAG TPA: EamA family transporter [Gaiellaceae bacterium]|nr:EamA family transporter [Gaiellaceae bacterium]
MSSAALGLALGAAVLHALWNLLLAGSRDVLAATAVALGSSLVVALPFALATWGLEREAIPWLVASGALELAYFFTLTAAYHRAELSLVYPLARGGAPVLVLLGAVATGYAPGGIEVLGVLAVAAGVVLVRGQRGGDRLGVVLGLVIAAQIAAYTLVDAEGIQHANPVPYLLLALVPTAVGAALVSGRERLRAEWSARAVLAGCGGFLAYVLVLAALRLAPAAPVAAVRETSVLFAVALAAPLLGERVTRGRVAGAMLVVAGVGALGSA